MSDHDRTTVVTSGGGNGGLYFVVGVLLVAVVVGAYVLMGAPGLNHQVANAPGGQKIDITVQQPATPAPAPAPSRPERAPERR